jgi:rubrerythrin
MSDLRDDTVLHVLQDALKMETEGSAFFRNALLRVKSPDAARAIEQLVEEEEDHVGLISRTIAKLVGGECQDETVAAIETRIPADYFDAQSLESFLRLIRKTPTLPDVAVFEEAWRMEKEIAEFYERAARIRTALFERS